MKQKNSGFVAVLFAFASILVTWLIQEHFVELVTMWKQAKAKLSSDGSTVATNDQKQTVNESVQ